MVYRPPRKWLTRKLVRPPFQDDLGRKGWFRYFSRPQPHIIRQLALTLRGWPHWPRPLRVLFLSDFHTGSHDGDVARFTTMIDEAAQFRADLVLYGGDYVNLQPIGGGRIPPRMTAAILARLEAPCGRFAVIGNHDVIYGADDVNEALREKGITVLDDEQERISFGGCTIAILGIPDAEVERPEPKTLISRLAPDAPAIILSHDPVWFGLVNSPAHLTLAGHTHGGQVRLPYIGPVTNQSRAPLRWTYGHITEEGRHLYVTSGLGTSVVPLRFGIPPELVVLELNGAPAVS